MNQMGVITGGVPTVEQSSPSITSPEEKGDTLHFPYTPWDESGQSGHAQGSVSPQYQDQGA